jgi:hypothetical protein
MAAVTVRMSDEDLLVLRDQAEREDRSMNDVAVLAIRERAARSVRVESDQEAIRRAIAENGPLLELLAQ